MRTEAPMIMAVDVFINGNGNSFYKSQPEDKPRRELGDYIASNDPQPDNEEYWGMPQ